MWLSLVLWVFFERSVGYTNSNSSPEMIFNMYIYDRKGKCLFYKEWSRPLNTLSDDPEEEKKLMYGMVYSLKELTSKISPSKGPEGLHTVKTNVRLPPSPLLLPSPGLLLVGLYVTSL